VYQWDPRKAASNLRKHRVGFQEAATVFHDPLHLTFPDPDHSVLEQRFLTFGMSARGRVLVVAHADVGAEVRIISARRATKREKHGYTEGS
jgi:uncharacterized DUF497 family protein